MAEQILNSDLSEGDTILISYDKEKSENDLQFETRKGEPVSEESEETTEG
jgi:hypothetical protein